MHDDVALADRARQGEVGAFEELVARHQDVAVRTAWVITGARDTAADAAQEGFVKAYRALDRFRPGAAFRPWLLQIVANEARNRRRSEVRYAGLALRVAVPAGAADPAPSPEDAALATERREELVAALRLLRDSDRTVIACRYLLDLPEAETAAVLGCAAGTVKSRLSRALRRLRSVLEEGGRP